MQHRDRAAEIKPKADEECAQRLFSYGRGNLGTLRRAANVRLTGQPPSQRRFVTAKLSYGYSAGDFAGKL